MTQLPRVYPIVDTTALERHGCDTVHGASAFLEGGARILQFRHKGFWSRDVFQQAQEIAVLCRQAKAVFVVNDRADYAMLLQAGLHLGQDDLLPADARRVIGVTAMIGFSTHNEGQMLSAESEPVDYVAFGPMFGTGSKERPDPPVGVARLAAVRAMTAKPLVAIGGITRDNASICWTAGADSVAVIADLLPAACTQRNLRDRMVEWNQLSSR